MKNLNQIKNLNYFVSHIALGDTPFDQSICNGVTPIYVIDALFAVRRRFGDAIANFLITNNAEEGLDIKPAAFDHCDGFTDFLETLVDACTLDEINAAELNAHFAANFAYVKEAVAQEVQDLHENAFGTQHVYQDIDAGELDDFAAVNYM